jgi:hypothetical protein
LITIDDNNPLRLIPTIVINNASGIDPVSRRPYGGPAGRLFTHFGAPPAH